MNKTKIVEMVCNLATEPADQYRKEIALPEGFTTRSLKKVSEDDLYPCYLAAFQAGDSQLFLKQSEIEQREFYETLAFDQARTEPGTSMILQGDRIVGFTYVVPYGESNRHISCMCVHPDCQRQGLGSFMLNYAKKEAALGGYQTITLWTEMDMGAFELYRKHGFEITEEKEL
jgi:ribosomal protein S18 acetylase RimI-like enzyme